MLANTKEQSLFLSQEVADLQLDYRVVLGSTAGWAAHGHFLTLYIHGPRIEQVLKRYRENQADWERLPRDESGRPIIRLPLPEVDS